MSLERDLLMYVQASCFKDTDAIKTPKLKERLSSKYLLWCSYLCHKHPSSSHHQQNTASYPIHQSNGNKGSQHIDDINDAACH